MTGTLGTSDRAEDILDGTLCRQESPCPGPGRDATATARRPNRLALQKVNSIRQRQEKIRRQIRGIESQLKFLDEHHVPDSQPWISFNKVSSIEDLKSKFTSLREVLRNDIQVLRECLHDMEMEAGRERRSALRKRALTTTGAFDRDLENLLLHAENTGELDTSHLEGLRGESDRALRRWQEAVEGDPSPRNMKGLLSQLARTMQVGLDERSDAAQDAWRSLGDCATKAKQSAEKRFRASPTVHNFRDYVQKAVTSMQLGGEGLAEMPTGLQRLRPEKSHVVKVGDSLSAISKLFYGTPSFWDFIFLTNLESVGDDPERIRPNIELQIP